MTYTLQVENIKCGGCANSIRGRLTERGLAEAVEVDVDQGLVHIQGDPSGRDRAIEALASMGYPESGSVEGMRAATAKARSFVSCAVGRIDNARHKPE
jgi:copper chaperone